MFYTIAHRHGWIHGRIIGGVESFSACYPGARPNTEHKTIHGAKLALTRDWKLYCTNNAEWARLNKGTFTFNPKIKSSF